MAREKQVFTDISDIAHLWAHSRQDHARNPQNNFYFYGNKIFSYGSHFEIARKIADATPVRNTTVLFTTGSYSNTTARHISVTYMAIPSFWNIIYIPNFHELKKKYTESDIRLINGNIKYYITIIGQLVDKQQKARSKDYTENIELHISRLKDYVEYFKVQKYILKPYKFLLTADMDEILSQFGIAKAKEAKARKAAETKEAKERKKKQEAMVAEWLEGYHGKSDIFPYVPNVVLRLKSYGDYQQVETSKGISINVGVARNLLNFLRTVREQQMNPIEIKAMMENASFQRMKFTLGWNVDRITPDGDLIAGCHHILWSEIERFATKYNW